MRPLTTIEIIVALIVVLFAAQFFVSFKKEPTLSEAIKSGDVLQCDKIANENDRAQCQGALQTSLFSKGALEKNDPKICLNIADAFLRERCKDPFATKEAIEKKDVSLCPMIKNTTGPAVFADVKCQDLVYMSIASEKKDSSLCDKVTEKVLRDVCVSGIKEALSKAKAQSVEIEHQKELDSYRGLVLRAISEKNEKLCDLVKEKWHDPCVKAVREGITGAWSVKTLPVAGQAVSN